MPDMRLRCHTLIPRAPREVHQCRTVSSRNPRGHPGGHPGASDRTVPLRRERQQTQVTVPDPRGVGRRPLLKVHRRTCSKLIFGNRDPANPGTELFCHQFCVSKVPLTALQMHLAAGLMIMSLALSPEPRQICTRMQDGRKTTLGLMRLHVCQRCSLGLLPQISHIAAAVDIRKPWYIPKSEMRAR